MWPWSSGGGGAIFEKWTCLSTDLTVSGVSHFPYDCVDPILCGDLSST